MVENSQERQYLRVEREGCRLTLRIQPKARKPGIRGLHGGALKIAIAAPPTDGKANEELIHYLAQEIGCTKGELRLVKGETSRDKIVFIQSSALENLLRWLDSEGL